MEEVRAGGIARRDFVAGAAGVAGAAALAGGLGSVAGGSALASEKAGSSSAGGEEGAGVVWPGEPLDASTLDITETFDCELLICGLGAGGSVAVCEAAAKGMDVIAIEKNAAQGSIKSFICAVNSKPQLEAGVWIDANEVAKELVRYASGYANMRLIKTYLEESAGLVDWIDATFADDGVACYAETDIGDGTHDNFKLWPVQVGYRINYDEETQAKLDAIEDPQARKMASPGIAQFCIEHAQADGADIKFDTQLVQLVQDASGKVTGAIAQSTDDGHYLHINASKGVLLATGGYEADPDLLAYLNPDGALLGGVGMAQPGCVGDGIRAGIWAGGKKDQNATLMTFERAALPVDAEPGYPYQGTSCWIGDQPFLKVNTRGERFCDETSPYDWPLHAATMEPGHKFCSIWDANYVESIKTFHTMGCSRIDPSPDQPDAEGLTFEALDAQIEQAKQLNCVQQADTVEELAEKLGMEPDTLARTVERYNELAAAGVDDDFGKPAKDLIALDNPPFYGCFFAGHVLCTIDGLQINEDCQVINASTQEPIEGLYAVGNCSGSFYSVTYPELLWGNANGRTCTCALHVVHELAGA